MTSPDNFTLHPKYQVTENYYELPGQNLNFFYSNVRSIRQNGKLKTLKSIILDTILYEVDVIILTETWIKDHNEAQETNLIDYEHFFNIREGQRRGGGVSIYVKKKHEPVLSHTECVAGANFLWVYLKTYKLYIGGIYKPQKKKKDNETKFFEEYSSQLQNMGTGQAIVFGDFNINLRIDKETQAKEYKRTLKEYGFKLLNNEEPKYSTRTKPETRTIIDHVSTNLSDSVYQAWHLAVIESKTLSDHNQLYLAVPKIAPSECRTPSSNKRMRLNSNDDLGQATTAEEDTDDAYESDEADEMNNDNTSVTDDNRSNQGQHRSSSPDNSIKHLSILFD